MITFTYTGRRRSGDKVSGQIDATNKSEAQRQLEIMGIVLITLSSPPEPENTTHSNRYTSTRQGAPICGQAIASISLAIASVVFYFANLLFSIPAIICGHVALSRIRKDPYILRGLGLARAGLIVAYFGAGYLVIDALSSSSVTQHRATPQTRIASPPSTPRPNTTQLKESVSKAFGDAFDDAMRESGKKINLTPVVAQPQSEYPNALTVLSVLFEGEGFVDTGRYSFDQQQQIFNDTYRGNQYFVYGQITDVGTSLFTERKYITLMVTKGHYFQVYPDFDFDLLEYSKGQNIGFIGTWTTLGSGILSKHQIEQAGLLGRVGHSSVIGRQNAPSCPYDQQQFARQIVDYKRQYRDTERLGNDLNLEAVLKMATGFIENPRQITSWIGKAKGVNVGLFNTTWVDAEYDGIEYNLYPSSAASAGPDAMLQALKAINKGAWIQFTGKITGSTRLTKTGALLDPEMRVEVTYIQVIAVQP